MSLEGVSPEPRQSTAIVPPPVNLASLPQELLNQIFRDVSPRDIQAAACVSRGMNRIVKEAANFNEPYSIKNFIKILMLKILMQKMPEQIERLAKIAENINSQNFPNLLLLKGYILDVKAPLINVIKTLDEGTINDLLHHVQPPHFLEDIFTLADIERQIDEAHLIPDDYLRKEAFVRISEALTRTGNIDRALSLATSISDDYVTRNNMFRAIFKTLVRSGDIERALALVTSIPTEFSRGDALRIISLALARAGNIDRALEVATSIPINWMRGEALLGISQVLTRAGNIDRSLKIATSLPNDCTRGDVLGDISRALTRAGNIDRSLEVAGLIPNDGTRNESTRGFAFWDIVQALTEADDIDRSLEVATSISDSWVREQALQDISHALTRKGDMVRAQAVAKLISVEDRRGGFALGDICSLQ